MLDRLLRRSDGASAPTSPVGRTPVDPPPVHDQATLRSLMVANAYRNVQPAAGATGHRSSALRLRTLGEPGGSHPAEEFLLACQVNRHDRGARESVEGYFQDDAVHLLTRIDVEARSGGERRIDLSAPLPVDASLSATIASRRSCRTFSPSALPLSALATLLAAAASSTGTAVAQLPGGGEVTFPLRAVPSAGGLYPIAIYVIAQRVQSLRPAVHRYAPRYHQLVEHPEAMPLSKLSTIPGEEDVLDAAAAVLLLVARPWRSVRKYGARGLRYALIEAGAMAQAIHLTAAGLGLGSLDWGSSSDHDVHSVLGLDGLRAALVHAILVGPAEE